MSRLLPPQIQSYQFDEWNIESTKSHIMGSQCENLDNCAASLPCNFCRFEKELKLPSLPDMVFASNCLCIKNEKGGTIKFNALNSLKSITLSPPNIEVAHAKAWQEARSDCEYSKRIEKNFDWTYSTKYAGTIEGFESQPTNQRIDLEKLKVQDEIKFYQEIYLYEDELDDNGSTKCTVKVRVMPTGFFIVFRHYLRVDHVVIRVNDTRLYFSKGTDYILRESSTRECPMNQLKVPQTVYNNPDLIWQYLPLLNETVDKLTPVSK